MPFRQPAGSLALTGTSVPGMASAPGRTLAPARSRPQGCIARERLRATCAASLARHTSSFPIVAKEAWFSSGALPAARLVGRPRSNVNQKCSRLQHVIGDAPPRDAHAMRLVAAGSARAMGVVFAAGRSLPAGIRSGCGARPASRPRAVRPAGLQAHEWPHGAPASASGNQSEGHRMLAPCRLPAMACAAEHSLPTKVPNRPVTRGGISGMTSRPYEASARQVETPRGARPIGVRQRA